MNYRYSYWNPLLFCLTAAIHDEKSAFLHFYLQSAQKQGEREHIWKAHSSTVWNSE